MAKQQFNRLIWLVDTIYRSGRITFSEINRRWRTGDAMRTDIPLRTFHNHRQAIEDMFDMIRMISSRLWSWRVNV